MNMLLDLWILDSVMLLLLILGFRLFPPLARLVKRNRTRLHLPFFLLFPWFPLLRLAYRPAYRLRRRNWRRYEFWYTLFVLSYGSCFVLLLLVVEMPEWLVEGLTLVSLWLLILDLWTRGDGRGDDHPHDGPPDPDPDPATPTGNAADRWLRERRLDPLARHSQRS